MLKKTAWERHCFLPDQNWTKIGRELGGPKVRLWLTYKTKQSFFTIDVEEQSTNQIRQGETCRPNKIEKKYVILINSIFPELKGLCENEKRS